jgi:hypothetical protein
MAMMLNAANRLFDFAAQFGALRLMLALATVSSALFVQKPGTSPVYAGWEFVPTVLAPVMTPLVLMVLLLDVLMSWVMRVDSKGRERVRLRHILVTELLLAAGLVVLWLPYYLALGKT